MRTLEIILLAIVTILPFVKRPLLKIGKNKYLPIILVLTLTFHLIFDGWRWQMIPGYFILFILIWRIISIKEIGTIKLTLIRGVGYTVLLVLIVVSWILPNFLPVFSLPTPTGKYLVGTNSIHLKTNMDEPITNDPDDQRELMIKVWYPAITNTSVKQDPYLDKVNRTGFINKYGGGILPPFAMNYLDKVKTHVYQDAPISDEVFPVLVFSHGYGSNASGYYALLSEIASHGYIILNVNHTYESLGSTFPDNSTKFFNYQFMRDENVGVMKHINLIKDAFNNNLSYDERHAVIREASKAYNATNMVKRWAKDIRYTIDQLEDWNKAGFLKDKLNLDKIGVFGHSRGGGAAGQVTIKDHRIKAAANIDGIQWGEMMDTIYHKPFLYISSDWPANHQDVNAHVYKYKSSDYFYESKLLNSGHPNFMDIPFMIPVKSLTQAGTIDPKLGIKITNELIITFFNKHLKNDESSDLKKIDERYKLLELNVYVDGIKN